MVANLLCQIRWVKNINNGLTNYNENYNLRSTKLIMRHNFLLRNTLFLHEENSCAINIELYCTQIDKDPIRESRTHRTNQIANIYSNIASEHEKQIFETQSNTVARCRVSFFSSHFLRHQWLTWIIEQSRKTNRRKYSTKSLYSRFVLADIL